MFFCFFKSHLVVGFFGKNPTGFLPKNPTFVYITSQIIICVSNSNPHNLINRKGVIMDSLGYLILTDECDFLLFW